MEEIKKLKVFIHDENNPKYEECTFKVLIDEPEREPLRNGLYHAFQCIMDKHDLELIYLRIQAQELFCRKKKLEKSADPNKAL